jgi:anaerobic ribonucleoside-triphosphate reductase activating protein
MNAPLRLAGVIRESIVDGPGIRFTVFTQGCPHACPGCHNPETWAPDGGYETTVANLIAEIRKDPLLKGVTLSGGEPFTQSAAMAELSQEVHALGLDVMTYTGYAFEDLLEMSSADPGIMQLLKQTDILVDGKFIRELKSLELRFRGSSNQRVIDVRKSLETGMPVPFEFH